MNNQRHLFNLTENIHYLNCAYMSPLLASVEEAGVNALVRLRNPSAIKPEDFFSEQEKAKKLFGRLINGNPEQVAIIPSVSYGLKTAITNIPVNDGTHAIMVYDEFPSDYYALAEWCKSNNKQLKIIPAPDGNREKGKRWNEAILDAIQPDTSTVVLSSVHWMNGTKFDLEKIGMRCRDVGARFIVDGSQSVGVLPIDVAKYKIDALVCTGYKWLFGPYSIGLAYYGDSYKEGKPIEDSWMNRANADDFTNLTGYTDQYKTGAGRFNVGESSHFILLPMLIRALEQVLEWQELSLQTYCGSLIQPLLRWLRENDFTLEEEDYRVNHLFGIALPEANSRESLLKNLQEKKIIVSVRSNLIRVSTHVFNTGQDIDQLLGVLQNSYR